MCVDCDPSGVVVVTTACALPAPSPRPRRPAPAVEPAELATSWQSAGTRLPDALAADAGTPDRPAPVVRARTKAVAGLRELFLNGGMHRSVA